MDPIFTFVPSYGRKRIFGTENEYGVGGRTRGLPGFIANGGKIYSDCGHIEYATPECSNPLEAVIYNKAGELLAQKYADKIYKNNVDSRGNTFGAHENYFTKASFKRLRTVIPFLVTRQIYAGTGKQMRYGFSISQRSCHIEKNENSTSSDHRAILCTKKESLANDSEWMRLHLILGDANMSEVAEFLKIGTTGLVLDLVEDGLEPRLEYNNIYSVQDLHSISESTSDWQIRQGEKATDIQRGYLKAAKKHYKGRDEITDTILALWQDTLDKLDRDPSALIGRVDWITKKALIDQYAQANNLDMTSLILRNIDLQYHDTDRERGLFYALQKQGKVERLATDEMIKHAMHVPPNDTRASLRGALAKQSDIYRIEWYSFHLKNLVIQLADPFQAELSEEQKERVANIRTDLPKDYLKKLDRLPKDCLNLITQDILKFIVIKNSYSQKYVYQHLYPAEDKLPKPYMIIQVERNLGKEIGSMPDRYFYGGTLDQVPLKTKGIINRVENGWFHNKIEAILENGRTWALEGEEVALFCIDKNIKDLVEDLTSHDISFKKQIDEVIHDKVLITAVNNRDVFRRMWEDE